MIMLYFENFTIFNFIIWRIVRKGHFRIYNSNKESGDRSFILLNIVSEMFLM